MRVVGILFEKIHTCFQDSLTEQNMWMILHYIKKSKSGIELAVGFVLCHLKVGLGSLCRLHCRNHP